MRSRQGRELTGPLVTELAREGDPVAREAIERIGEALGVGLVSLVNIFNPEVAVIGGGVSAAGELLLEPARRLVRERALAPGRRGGADRAGGVRSRGGAGGGGAGRARGRRPPAGGVSVSARLIVRAAQGASS